MKVDFVISIDKIDDYLNEAKEVIKRGHEVLELMSKLIDAETDPIEKSLLEMDMDLTMEYLYQVQTQYDQILIAKQVLYN